MSTATKPGQLVLSIDLSHAAESPSDGDGSVLSLPRHADQIGRAVNEHGLTATWIASHAATPVFVEQLQRFRAVQELAILSETGWAGRDVSRKHFAEELARRTSRVRTSGLIASTLIVPEIHDAIHFDVASKYGIRAIIIAGPSDPRPRGLASSIIKKPTLATRLQTLRFGVVAVPISVKWPRSTSAWFGTGSRKLQRMIQAAASAGSLLHVMIDARAIDRGGRPAIKAWEKLLDRTMSLVDRGALTIGSVDDAVNRLWQSRQGRPSRSILREAA